MLISLMALRLDVRMRVRQLEIAHIPAVHVLDIATSGQTPVLLPIPRHNPSLLSTMTNERRETSVMQEATGVNLP